MTNKESGLKNVKELVIRFNEQLPSYKKSDYNETLTRRDFIDPLFKALGWDIDNAQGFAESYREVIHEDKVKVGKATKAPDYSFRLGGGQRLFFVEAKKPSIFIKDDIQPAYQVRRYGWSAKLNVSVITDFEEFAIYDCTKKPNPTDKTSVARVKYITFNDYEKEWDFLWNTFSKEAVLKGSFDKFIGGNANKKGTATVDKEFLTSLDQWRTLLAETISKENKQLDEDELNFVVQQTLDRIIFLRICEDRSIEPYGSLQAAVKSGDYYNNLLQEFKQADDKYNSGLFDFKKDTISHQLTINNKTLKIIINELYYPECPYEFSVLSVEILGSAYEQFLGKTITINNRGKAVIELKPEVRKAGGVYYTPQYIVDYIVTNTVGKLCDNKTPSQVTEIKIVDPACGSGSFLLGAYQYLLNWHKDYYTQNPSKKNPITPEGNLTTPEKKKILLNNIYGVDIDANAVEVTKLSLLLKCMEGETQASIAHQMTMFKQRVLPTLEANIKSGNSLIDTDYYDNQLDFGEERKIKPFSWQKAFPSVFKSKLDDQNLLTYHITCVMHCTRMSQRMIDNNVTLSKVTYLTIPEEEKLLEIITLHIKENKLSILALNVCADHLHFCIVCNAEKLTTIVGKLKSMTARAFNIWRGITEIDVTYNNKSESAIDELQSGQDDETRGHAPLSNSATPLSDSATPLSNSADPLSATPTAERGVTQNSLWAQKFNRQQITDDKHLHNVINYITNNRVKHNLPELSNATIQKINEVLKSYEQAYTPQVVAGGFDVVIGNPPYVFTRDVDWSDEVKNYFWSKFEIAKGNDNSRKNQSGKINLYILFIIKSTELLNKNGCLSFIIPNGLLRTTTYDTARKFILERTAIERIVDLKDGVFEGVTASTIIITLLNNNKKRDTLIIDANCKIAGFVDETKTTIIKQSIFLNNVSHTFSLYINLEEQKIFTKISNSEFYLKDIVVDIIEGIVAHKEFISDKILSNEYKPMLEGKDIKKFQTNFGGNYVLFDRKKIHRARPDYVWEADKKIVIQRISGGKSPLVSTIDKEKYLAFASTNLLLIKDDFEVEYPYELVCGLINSKLWNFYYSKNFSNGSNLTVNISKTFLEMLPLPKQPKKDIVNAISSIVEKQLTLNEEIKVVNLETKRDQIKSKIEYNEEKINALVYQLYNLTDEEKKIVENG